MEQLLGKLINAFGPSGCESRIREVIEQEIKGHADKIFTDPLGNLVAVKEGARPRLMLAAHMDELGLMVTYIDEKGFARIANVGGISPSLLVGKRVIFENGVIGTINHEKIKELKELDWTKLYLDTGAANREEASSRIKIGDVAVYDQGLEDLGNRLLGKAMDDRIGCAVLIETLKRLPASLPHEVVFVFTVQEEVGLRGARTAAYGLNPDYGLAVDVTRVGDTPEAPLMDVSLGKGPAVKIKDSSLICHPRVRHIMIKVAEDNKLDYQLEVLVSGGTDAGAIQLTRQGVPSGVLSIPCRYVHTPSEMVDKKDVNTAVDLLEKLCLFSWPAP